MKQNRIFLLLLGAIFTFCLEAYPKNYRISNIRLNVVDNQLRVNYDLLAKRLHEPVPVRLLFYDSQYRIYAPKAVTLPICANWSGQEQTEVSPGTLPRI
jgi:hypothetical protein